MNRPMRTYKAPTGPCPQPDERDRWDPETFILWRLPLTNRFGVGPTPLPLPATKPHMKEAERS